MTGDRRNRLRENEKCLNIYSRPLKMGLKCSLTRPITSLSLKAYYIPRLYESPSLWLWHHNTHILNDAVEVSILSLPSPPTTSVMQFINSLA